MFGVPERKLLIVVYKDEMLLNQFKKMIETNDDQKITGEGKEPKVIGTVDDSINIISWTEEVWLSNKKSGNIKGKVLFLGNIQGTNMLIPVLDVKYNKFGISYGWAGDQAVIHADVNALNQKEEYQKFLAELEEMPVPKVLKTLPPENTPQEIASPENTQTPKNIFESVFSAIAFGANAVSKASSDLIQWVGDVFRDKALIERQMLFYGVIKMYEDHLQAFMDE